LSPLEINILSTLLGEEIVSVQIEQPGGYGFILIESLLKPVICIPEPVFRPVDAVLGQSLIRSRTFVKMRQDIKKVGQVLFPDIKKVVGIGSDEAGDKIGTVLCYIELSLFTEQMGDIAVPLIDYDGDGQVFSIFQTDPHIGE